MCRALLVAALVAAVPGVVRAEPFTVWESGGNIYARNEATGYEWALTGGDWPWGGSNPDVAGNIAVWQGSDGTWATIQGYALKHQFPLDHFVVFGSPYGGTPTNPEIGVVDPTWWGDYWCAFQLRGSVWAQHLDHGNWDADDTAFEVLPGYTGWFDVEAATLMYDGGSVTLDDPPPPPATPEPGTLVLLATGTVGLLLVWRRRRRTAQITNRFGVLDPRAVGLVATFSHAAVVPLPILTVKKPLRHGRRLIHDGTGGTGGAGSSLSAAKRASPQCPGPLPGVSS